jgi:hypothetical protein
MQLEVIVNTAKNEIQSLLQKLPDDCSYEDIQYHLYVIEKIRKGIERTEIEGVVSQDEVEKRFDRWTTK